MTNWRDGSINFEQRGVEFPDFWSVNAVNIVTSKYFRGAVGTPQRETGLKQLIDRIVKTYTKAGEEYGYFASPADAEIFEHELAYALLHQIFSFNSPVWFNVGTPQPQQVSACFILSVDDSMESILDRYKKGIDVGSPFDYPKQGILYVAKHLSRPARDGDRGDMLDEMTELIKNFAADPRTCLFGTLSLWQGVDVPGASCQLVVMDKIPFPRPDDPLMSARQKAVEEAGGNGFMAVAATHAALLMAQGAGRLGAGHGRPRCRGGTRPPTGHGPVRQLSEGLTARLLVHHGPKPGPWCRLPRSRTSSRPRSRRRRRSAPSVTRASTWTWAATTSRPSSTRTPTTPPA
ncbi:helicase C-terminal domain-containing protein [Streptomyces zaomyceticus]|uniref:helicase C-terminal domain-containing protein n=1 Tax=Streptomyces zaomyceticus TaxID=68286 RepID=UPI002F9095A6